MNKIPFEKIKEFYEKYGKMSIKTKEQMQEYQKALDEQLDIMRSIKAEDLESLTLEEFGKIPIGWLFDWNKVTGTFEDEGKILQLYKSCDTQSLPKKEPKKFDYEDINKILPNEQLRFYLKNILIYDEGFISDIDKCMWSPQENSLVNKSVDEKMQYFNNNIGNTSRTYIYKLFALKHIYNILLKNMNYYMDEFWLNRLNRVLQENNSVDDFYNNIGKAIANSCNIQTKEEKEVALQEIIDRGVISISCLQRIFHISFSNAASIIEEAMSFGFIKKEKHAYTITNKESLKQYLIDILLKQ